MRVEWNEHPAEFSELWEEVGSGEALGTQLSDPCRIARIGWKQWAENLEVRVLGHKDQKGAKP